jgi:hypothetical protein
MTVTANAGRHQPGPVSTDDSASARTALVVGGPWLSFATTAAVASAPNPTTVTRMLPAATASSGKPGSARTAAKSLAGLT